MAEEIPVWNINAKQWQEIAARAQGDSLEDGAYVRVNSGHELIFYATALNKPPAWHFPLTEPIPNSRQVGATVGRAWHEAETGFVQFEVSLFAAAQALSADYESGVSDLDYVTYEQAVEQAMRGTPADLAWLHSEFARLVSIASL